MKRHSFLYLLLGMILACDLLPLMGGKTLFAGIEWNRGKTWVFVVGLLEWEDSKMWPPFPEAKMNRCDEQLVQHFRESGIPEEQVVYLQDSEATLEKIESEFIQFLDQTDEGDLLVFYFCGHGSRDRKTGKTSFANYDAGSKPESLWNVVSIFRQIEEHFSGEAVLLMADCCHSGALYDEAVKRRNGKISFATLTSSYSHNSSTGNWTFSDSVLSGLRGEPQVDENRDRRISLSELAKFTELEMAFLEEQKSMFQPASKLPAEMKLTETDGTSKPQVGLRIQVEWKGNWYKARSIDARDDQLRVHYIGYGREWDEWVGPSRYRPFRPTGFNPGTSVDVQWTEDKKWYPAQVLKQWYGLHLIHYDDYDSTWDEWVRPSAIRLRSSTP